MMLIRRVAGAYLMASLGLAGCTTHLATGPDRVGTADPGDAELGVAYALPMAQYDITLTRSVSGCPAGQDAPIDLAGQQVVVLTAPLEFSRKAEATVRYAPGERYVVDYRALEAPFKTTGFSFNQYSNGTLKTINASADDQSGEVVKNVVKIGFTVAAVTAGSPAAAAAAAAAAGQAGMTAQTQEASATANAALFATQANRAAAFFSTGAQARAKALRVRAEAERQKAEQARRMTQALQSLASRADLVQVVVCKPQTAELLKASKDAADSIERATPGLKAATADVTRLTVVANLKAAHVDHVTALDQALRAQAAASAGIEALTEAKGDADGKLAVTQALNWPTAFRDGPGALSLDGEARRKLEGLLELKPVRVLTAAAFIAWFDSLPPDLAAEFRKNKAFNAFFDKYGTLVTPQPPLAACHGPRATAADCVADQASAFAQFQRSGTGLNPCTGGQGEIDCARYDYAVQELREGGRGKDEALAARMVYGRRGRDDVLDSGVFVRQPALGMMWICPGSPASAPNLDYPPCDASKRLYRSDPVSTPQLGQLRYLPFRNEPFEANELALTLREDGSLESFSYKKTRAAGTGAVAAAADAVEQYKTFRDAQDKKKSEALTSARAEQIAQLQYQIDLLTKKKEILKLQAPPDAEDPNKSVKAETAQIDAQVALLNAKLAQLKAEAALADAQSG